MKCDPRGQSNRWPRDAHVERLSRDVGQRFSDRASPPPNYDQRSSSLFRTAATHWHPSLLSSIISKQARSLLLLAEILVANFDALA
jgi:hypothetical protein